MKVYLIWEKFYYESPELLKIFINYDLASEYIEELEIKNEDTCKKIAERFSIYEKYIIEEKEVIGEIE